LVGSPAPPLDLDAGRPLSPLFESALLAAGSEQGMSQEDAVKRWAATTYALALDEIERVRFEVQYANLSDPDAPTLELEIDVRMTDGHQHLFTRRVCEFGQIVEEVLAETR
jgi:hypothetical protein